MMTLKATTTHPDEVRKHFHDYAEVLEIYASDQLASLRWNKAGKARRIAELKSDVYREIADEIRSIAFEQEAQP